MERRDTSNVPTPEIEQATIEIENQKSENWQVRSMEWRDTLNVPTPEIEQATIEIENQKSENWQVR